MSENMTYMTFWANFQMIREKSDNMTYMTFNIRFIELAAQRKF